MKIIEQNNQGYELLGKAESGAIRGGLIPAALLVGLVLSALNNFGDIREGFSDGYHLRNPRH